MNNSSITLLWEASIRKPIVLKIGEVIPNLTLDLYVLKNQFYISCSLSYNSNILILILPTCHFNKFIRLLSDKPDF